MTAAADRIEALEGERDTLAGIVRRYRDGWDGDEYDEHGWTWCRHDEYHATAEFEPINPAEQAVVARLAERKEPSDG